MLRWFSGVPMTEVDIAGFGVWSQGFSGREEFRAVLDGRDVDSDGALKPELIPARERRRAPAAVKMAVEVMDQACRMAGVDAADVACVFGSGMSDMEITDYMCRTLVSSPRAVSPTKFHNSVHNAATGYWSIATASHCPANAVCAYDGTAAATLLEAAIQAVEESVPVVMAVEELAAPKPFRSIVDIDEPFAAALLLIPPGQADTALGSLALDLRPGAAGRAKPPALGDADLADNFAAILIPLLAALATGDDASLSLPLTGDLALEATLKTASPALTAHAGA